MAPARPHNIVFFNGQEQNARRFGKSPSKKKCVRNLGNFMFNLFHKYDTNKKCMIMISYMCLSNEFIIKVIMNMKLVLTSKA